MNSSSLCDSDPKLIQNNINYNEKEMIVEKDK